MVVLHTRELKGAMSVSVVSSSSHRIGILMSDQGRFVSCIDCHLSLSFPDRTDHARIVKQFESRACTGPVLLKEALSARTAKGCAPTSEALNCFDFDLNSNPMWVFDNRTLACSAVNDAAVHDYGYSRREFLSMTMLDIRPSEGAILSPRKMSHTGTHASAKVLGKHQKKDGSVIDVEITRSEVLFNGCIADIMTAVDVTGRFSVPVGSSSSLSEW
jgi:PAS domain S-box-containing protein